MELVLFKIIKYTQSIVVAISTLNSCLIMLMNIRNHKASVEISCPI